jgi:Fe-S oxidoreductase
MHAGDGNVHVNIPVLSNDREMMHQAESIVDEVMAWVVAHGGVVSGEHGIGVTKLKYMDRGNLVNLSAYRDSIDEERFFNPEKLESLEHVNLMYTPSFNILELEAKILKRAALERLSEKISNCVRCGKCKVSCCMYYPAEQLYYHPRNKNLAIASVLEGLLYETQRKKETGFALLHYLENLADHCTICHKCAAPCPVDIDTGDVSILEREILKEKHVKHTPLVTRLSLSYLYSRSTILNTLFRQSVLKMGSRMSQLLSAISRQTHFEYLLPGKNIKHVLTSPLTSPSPKTLQECIGSVQPDEAMLFHPKGPVVGSVFYFPGCGSERLFSSISVAAITLLLDHGVRVLIPPPRLCCGYPFKANGDAERFKTLSIRNMILFSQLSEMFSYIDFDGSVVTCGTCMEMMNELDVPSLFGGIQMDVLTYLEGKGMTLDLNDGRSVLYHQPCHDSFQEKGESVMKQICGVEIVPTEHCCSEAGTLALSRPDISKELRKQKGDAIRCVGGNPSTILTNCPSCVQGLNRQDSSIKALHVVEYLANKLTKNDTEKYFKTMIRGHVDRVSL